MYTSKNYKASFTIKLFVCSVNLKIKIIMTENEFQKLTSSFDFKGMINADSRSEIKSVIIK